MPTPSGSTPVFGLPYPLETDIPDVATAIQVLALAVEAQLQQMQVPIGCSIRSWKNTLPSYGTWLFMQGQVLPVSSYPALAAAQPTWVSGSSITIPNTSGRYLIGAGGLYAAGLTGGAATVTLITSNIPSMTSSVSITDPGHTHDPVSGFEPFVQTASTFARVTSSGDIGAATVGTKTSRDGTGITGSVTVGGSSSPVTVTPLYIAAFEIVRAA